MAERRMFAKTIVLSDDFLDMPMSARCLYFTLAMLADDDGFINSPKSIMRQCGSSVDDMNILIAKRFVLTFQSGVVVIKHWRIHNLIQKDRYHETKYLEEKAQLMLDDNKAYTEAVPTLYTECIQDVPNLEPQVRLGKDRLVKDSIDIIESDKPTKPSKSKQKQFIPPTLEEIQAYCIERKNNVDAKKFYDYFTASEWHDSKGNKVKSWKQKIITWENNGFNNKPQAPQSTTQQGSGNIFVDMMIERGEFLEKESDLYECE